MAESRRHFRKRVEAALGDENLQRAMVTAMTGLRARREAAFTSYDFERGRQDLKRRRRENLDRLDDLLDEFRLRLEEVGGRFHLAADADEARRIIASICQDAGAGLVVKSKSMATEEILLNPHLESLGMEVVESDLGERTVQLTHTRPSHLIAPAIHLTKEDAARVFETEPDVGAIQRKFRESLRQKFIDAHVGISGANFAIAETGSLVVVESEGNGRMCLTLPETLISVVGIEKLLPSWRDLEVFLALLPRSSTAERMNPYTSIWSGVTAGDGPQKFHLVLLDNGRTATLADRIGRQALRCIRCSACLNVCPVYERVGGHAYGSPYAGPIGAIISPQLRGMSSPADEALPFASTLCGACYEVCPVAIDIPEALVYLRSQTRHHLSERSVFNVSAALLKSARGLGAAQRVGSVSRLLVARSGRIRRLPPPLSGWTQTRDAPAPPRESFRAWWRRTRGGSG